MRVALDLRALVGEPTGMARYLSGLIPELVRSSRGVSFTGFAHRPIAKSAHAFLPGVPVVTGRRWPSGLLWQQVRLPGLLASHRADLLHGTLYTIPLRLKIPTVLSVADLTTALMPEAHTAYNRLAAAPLIKASCRRATRVIALSEATRQDLVRLGYCGAEKIRVVPGAAGSAYRPAKNESERSAIRARFASGQPYLLSVGTVEPRKNLPRLLAAYALARGRLGTRTPPLLIAGPPGWKTGSLSRRLDRGVTGVHYLGRVSDSDLALLYRGAALFLYVSLYEGFGLPVVEAMQSGAPTVTSNTSSLPEAAAGGARLVCPSNESEIAEAMVSLWNSPAARKRLAAQGLRGARRFSWDASARKTLAVYREAYEEGIHGHDRD